MGKRPRFRDFGGVCVGINTSLHKSSPVNVTVLNNILSRVGIHTVVVSYDDFLITKAELEIQNRFIPSRPPAD